MIDLKDHELVRRAMRIKLVVSDNDGVFTDTGVYYSDAGEVMKRYSIRDGMGVERLREYGIETSIMTGEVSPNVSRRAEKLLVRHLYLGVKDKFAALQRVVQETSFSVHEIAYIGDDVNDLGILRAVAKDGLTACPGDAMPCVWPFVHYICKANGGYGAFRDFAEWLIALRAGVRRQE